MSSVFVTRAIPTVGISMLQEAGYSVDVNPHNRPLTHDELLHALAQKPYDAVLTLLTDTIDQSVFDSAPTVKIFANYGIGFDHFDVAEGKRRGIFMTNTPGGGADRVAEHEWALILALACHIVDANAFVCSGAYTGWDPMLFPGVSLANKVIGIVGAGRIGEQVARRASLGFCMKVVYFDVKPNEVLERDFSATRYESLDELLVVADFVTVHVPLLSTTHHLLDARRLALMKPTAYLINTSRGAVIDEQALVRALQEKKIAGAGLDVFEFEPTISPGLLQLDNVVVTPHIASSTQESREEIARLAASNIIACLSGQRPPHNVY